MSANIVQCLRDTATGQIVPAWLRAECEQAADRIEALESALRVYIQAHRNGNAVPPHIETSAMKLVAPTFELSRPTGRLERGVVLHPSEARR